MIELMRKATRLNLRITPEFRERIERLAEYHGLTLSSYTHSLLVRAIRIEENEMSDEFRPISKKKLAKVVARIEPAAGMSKKEIQKMIDEQAIEKPRKRKAG